MSAGAQKTGTEAWTIARVLAWATADFRARGLDRPRLDAEVLLADALDLDRVRLILESKRELTPDELGRFRERVRRRRTGEPVAYILGVREFYGLSFRVDSRVLIPRPDTETLVEVALDRTRRRDMFGNALDLCTGSGCVAITFAKKRPTWRVTALDLSEDALALARENALRLGAIFGVRFVPGDLYAGLDPRERFDLITANPPYIPASAIGALDPTIRDFEPRLALEGGDDGLEVIRRIAAEAPAHLAPGGVLALEIQFDQGERVRELVAQAGLTEIETRRDYGGHERVVSAVLPEAQGPV
jgi:release factor glutamine methyltransferase